MDIKLFKGKDNKNTCIETAEIKSILFYIIFTKLHHLKTNKYENNNNNNNRTSQYINSQYIKIFLIKQLNILILNHIQY